MDRDLAAADPAQGDRRRRLAGAGPEPAVAGDLAGGDQQRGAVGDAEGEEVGGGEAGARSARACGGAYPARASRLTSEQVGRSDASAAGPALGRGSFAVLRRRVERLRPVAAARVIEGGEDGVERVVGLSRQVGAGAAAPSRARAPGCRVRGGSAASRRLAALGVGPLVAAAREAPRGGARRPGRPRRRRRRRRGRSRASRPAASRPRIAAIRQAGRAMRSAATLSGCRRSPGTVSRSTTTVAAAVAELVLRRRSGHGSPRLWAATACGHRPRPAERRVDPAATAPPIVSSRASSSTPAARGRSSRAAPRAQEIVATAVFLPGRPRGRSPTVLMPQRSRRRRGPAAAPARAAVRGGGGPRRSRGRAARRRRRAARSSTTRSATAAPGAGPSSGPGAGSESARAIASELEPAAAGAQLRFEGVAGRGDPGQLARRPGAGGRAPGRGRGGRRSAAPGSPPPPAGRAPRPRRGRRSARRGRRAGWCRAAAPTRRRGRGAAVHRVGAAEQRPDRRLEVGGGVLVGGRQRLPHHRGRAARPDQETGEEADPGPDRDVLDADQPDLPADRVDQVEEDEDDDREGGLAGGEGDGAHRVGGEEDGERQQRPEDRRLGADGGDQEAAERRSRPGCRAARGRSWCRSRGRSSAAPRACRARPRSRSAGR